MTEAEKTIRISQYEYKNLLTSQHVFHNVEAALVAYARYNKWNKEADLDTEGFFKALRVIDPATVELIDEKIEEEKEHHEEA